MARIRNNNSWRSITQRWYDTPAFLDLYKGIGFGNLGHWHRGNPTEELGVCKPVSNAALQHSTLGPKFKENICFDINTNKFPGSLEGKNDNFLVKISLWVTRHRWNSVKTLMWIPQDKIALGELNVKLLFTSRF